MAAGIDWTWETFPEYLDAVDRLPKGINYAANVGHSALRTWAMGERAFDEAGQRPTTSRSMDRELRDALRAGAIGFTTSRTPNHETSDDRPVASRLAAGRRSCTLVGVMGDLGAGIFELAQESNGPGDGPRGAGRSTSAAWSTSPSAPACRSRSACWPRPGTAATGRASSA